MKSSFCVNLGLLWQNRFANQMHNLHSCRIEKRENGKVFLASINGKYFLDERTFR